MFCQRGHKKKTGLDFVHPAVCFQVRGPGYVLKPGHRLSQKRADRWIKISASSPNGPSTARTEYVLPTSLSCTGQCTKPDIHTTPPMLLLSCRKPRYNSSSMPYSCKADLQLQSAEGLPLPVPIGSVCFSGSGVRVDSSPESGYLLKYPDQVSSDVAREGFVGLRDEMSRKLLAQASPHEVTTQLATFAHAVTL